MASRRCSGNHRREPRGGSAETNAAKEGPANASSPAYSSAHLTFKERTSVKFSEASRNVNRYFYHCAAFHLVLSRCCSRPTRLAEAIDDEADEIMAEIAAKRLVKHLDRVGFVVAAGGDWGSGAWRRAEPSPCSRHLRVFSRLVTPVTARSRDTGQNERHSQGMFLSCHPLAHAFFGPATRRQADQLSMKNGERRLSLPSLHVGSAHDGPRLRSRFPEVLESFRGCEAWRTSRPNPLRIRPLRLSRAPATVNARPRSRPTAGSRQGHLSGGPA